MVQNEKIDREILRVLYPEDSIFLTKISNFSTEQKSITGHFFVSSDKAYTVTPIPYVTGEQLLRCINQLSYVLIGLLIYDKEKGFDCVDYSAFLKAMTEYNMWLAEHSMKHDSQIAKDKKFTIELKVTRARIVNGGLSVVYMEFSGPISGKLKFAARI